MEKDLIYLKKIYAGIVGDNYQFKQRYKYILELLKESDIECIRKRIEVIELTLKLERELGIKYDKIKRNKI